MRKSIGFWTLIGIGLGTVGVDVKADLLTQWNVVTLGNAYVQGPDAEGAVRVGGDLRTSQLYDVGGRKGGSSGTSLIVGGQVLNAGARANNGDALIGGASNGNVLAQPPYAVKYGPNAIAGVGLENDAAALQGYSAAFKAMSSTVGNTFTSPHPQGQPGSANFFVGSLDSGNAVFTVQASELFSNSKVNAVDLALSGGVALGAGQSIIINVGGEDIKLASTTFNFTGSFHANRANIIWNFYEATSIDFIGNNLTGSILAPNAVLTNLNTIEGSVFVRQLGEVDASGRIKNGLLAQTHTPLYNGYVPSTIAAPEPSSFAIAGIAALIATAFKARRRWFAV